MKIEKLYLKNFAGILAGSGKTEIEIDFNDSKNLVTLLLGENGSGKSVVMSMLSPLRQSTDNRDKLIIEDEKGYKEIHISHNNDKYIIKHFYGSSSKDNKSFMEKNGEELNDNGGVKTFNNLLKEEFNLTDDYFKIGKLGANVNSFVGLSPADRKKFIGNFIPNIDDILEAYENAKTNFNLVTKEIKRLEGTLDKLGDINNIRQLKDNIETEINNLSNEIESYKKNKYSIEIEINNLLGDSSLESLNMEIKDKEKEINNISKSLNELNGNLNLLYNRYEKLKEYDYDKIHSVMKTENENKIKLENKLENLLKEKEEKENKFIELNSFISKEEINNYNEKDLELLQTEKSRIEEEISNANEEINKIVSKCGNVEEDFNSLLTQKNNVTNYYDDVITIQNNYTTDIFNNTVKVDTDSLLQQIETIENKMNEITDEIRKIKAGEKFTNALEKRPSNCKDDTCPFIAQAVISTKELTRIPKLEEENEKLKNKYEELNKNLEYKGRINSFINDVINTSKNHNVPKNEIFNLMSKDIGGIKDDLIKEIDLKISLRNALDNKDKIVTKLENTNYKIESMLKDKELYENKKKMYEDKIIESDKLKSEISEIVNDIELTKHNINKNNKKTGILEKLEYSLSEINTKNTQKENLVNLVENEKNKIETVKSKDSQLSLIERELTQKENSKANLNTRLQEVYKNLNIAENALETYNKLSNNYNKYKLVKDSLDPKKGIPLQFIGDYLVDISESANKLLDIAYGGKFLIDFDLNDKDFNINVLKSDGTYLKDIKEASQGEFSMTTVSLSLAMMEKSIDKYNIVYLDEADATLSVENRRMFIEIIMKQLNQLGVEQAFIISHNNEFMPYPLDLILMDGAEIDLQDDEIMSNKKILYKN